MSKGGNNRDWGYASYDVDKYDDDSDSNLQYTSYEKDGSVNKYVDNGDGGHGHYHYNSSDDYNKGGEPDYAREESNNSPNPSTGEIQEKGGCYLTSACMQHFQENFDDDCYELRVLRWFRDNFVSQEDIKHYYVVAPYIVEAIDSEEHSDIIYDYIYDTIVDYCVEQIVDGNYEEAYKRYKNSILALEEQFAKEKLTERLITDLKTKVIKHSLA